MTGEGGGMVGGGGGQHSDKAYVILKLETLTKLFDTKRGQRHFGTHV